VNGVATDSTYFLRMSDDDYSDEDRLRLKRAKQVLLLLPVVLIWTLVDIAARAETMSIAERILICLGFVWLGLAPRRGPDAVKKAHLPMGILMLIGFILYTLAPKR
jgi:hypothetical protein